VREPGTAPIIAKYSEQFLGGHAGVPKGGGRRLVPPVILQCMSPLLARCGRSLRCKSTAAFRGTAVEKCLL
jgi:hypothetical protein